MFNTSKLVNNKFKEKELSMFNKLVVFLLCSIVPFFAFADVTGKVIGVMDGDTIKILTADKQEVKVRFNQIDAPEKDQPWGQNSKQALSDLIFGKQVTVTDTSTDKYKRTLGTVMLGSVNINKQQVANGNAWAYRQYLKDQDYISLEDKAKSAKHGLWSLQADQIMPPWEWRHGGKAKPNMAKVSSTEVKPKTSNSSGFECGGKTKCGQMSSCAEARFYLEQCGLGRLDRDKDGVPCESICN